MNQISEGEVLGVIIGTTVHIVVTGRESKTRYHLMIPGGRSLPYCCQDGCCDGGLRPDVESVVKIAKERGATQVVLRTGQRHLRLTTIAGLIVSDVETHVGDHGNGYRTIVR